MNFRIYLLIWILTTTQAQPSNSTNSSKDPNRSPKDVLSNQVTDEPLKPPVLSPAEDFDLSVNSTLILECTGAKPLDWYLHDAWYDISERVKLSESYNPEGGDKMFYSKLEIFNMAYYDTGSYECFYNGTVHNSSKTAGVYVYVNDPAEPILPLRRPGITYRSSEQLIIPCRTTNSKNNVSIWLRNREEIKVDNNTVFYDPRRGFIIPEPSHDLAGHVNCRSNLKETNIVVFLQYSPDHGPFQMPPIIDDRLAKHPMLHKSFSLNCSIEVEQGRSFFLFWQNPKGNMIKSNEKYELGEFTSQLIYNSHHLISYLLLTIKNATYEDAGSYKCFADGDKYIVSTNFSVTIHDKELVAHINLTTRANFIQNVTTPAQIVFAATGTMGLDTIMFFWYKDGLQLQPGANMNISTQKTSTKKYAILRFAQLCRNDSGNYTLKAMSGDTEAAMSFYLRIKGPPSVNTNEYSLLYYEAGRNYTLRCDLYGYPEVKVSWEWKKCSSFNPMVCDNYSAIVEPANPSSNFGSVTNLDLLPLDNYRSILFMDARESGIYKCIGENELGRSSQEIEFAVSDIQRGFEMKTYDLVVGMDAEFSCMANLMRYDPSTIEMLYKAKYMDPIQIANISNIIVQTTKTNYSQGVKVKINNVRIDQTGDYICHAQPLNEENAIIVETAHFINVSTALSPSFTLDSTPENFHFKLPMNVTKKSLNCTVTGRPTPRVSWFKEDGSAVNLDQMPFTSSDNGQRLVILYAVKKRVNGKYTCIADNLEGRISRSFTVEVIGDDDDTLVPVSMIVMYTFLPILFVAFIIVVLICATNHHKERKERLELEMLSQMLFDKGQLEMLNPNMPLDDQVELLPYDHKWEFPKDKLKLGRILGQGAFGRVVRAEATGMDDGETTTTVAVKMLKERADLAQRKALMAELKILIHLGKHLNIVNLLGAVTKDMRKGELLVIVEYCRYGNLRNYLLRHKSRFVNQLDPETGMLDPNLITLPNSPVNSCNTPNQNTVLNNPIYGIPTSNYANLMHQDSGVDEGCNSDGNYTVPITPVTPVTISTSGGLTFRWLTIKEADYHGQPVTTCDLLCFAFQCARGMEYLASRKLIHRDLAARNVLLAQDNIVKICDFGLAKDCYKYNNYVKKGDGLLPIKWMAIESLADKVFTTKSDVWSFGVLLWEFFTLGGDPYPGTDLDEEFYKKLKGGYRMEQPELCPHNVYGLMRECWSADPEKRPEFQSLAETLGDFLAAGVKQYYLELNTPYAEMNLEKSEDYLAMCGPQEPTANYLNMTTTENSTVVQMNHAYDNINCVKPIEDGSSVFNEPIESVPMIQLDTVRVHFKKDLLDDTPPESPVLGISDGLIVDDPNRNDYLTMGESSSKERSQFSRNRKGNESLRSDTSSGFHSDLETSLESSVTVPPSYNNVMESRVQEIEL